MNTYTFENEGFSVKNEGFTHKICVCAHLIQILCMKDKNFRTIRKKNVCRKEVNHEFRCNFIINKHIQQS